MQLRLMLLAALCVTAWAEVNREASLSAVRKFQAIAEGSLESGETVELTQHEMNAFLRFHAAENVPEGIEDPQVEFRKGGAIIRARVDLERSSSVAETLPPLMRLLLRGSRLILIDVDYSVQDGYATAKLASLEVETVELSGSALDWLLGAVAPPEWQPYLSGRKIRLDGGFSEVRLEPGRALIVIE